MCSFEVFPICSVQKYWCTCSYLLVKAKYLPSFHQVFVSIPKSTMYLVSIEIWDKNTKFCLACSKHTMQSKYCGDLNSELVWYSDHEELSVCGMGCYSDARWQGSSVIQITIWVQRNMGSWLWPVRLLTCPNKCSSQTHILFSL